MNDILIPFGGGEFRVGARKAEPGTEGEHVIPAQEGEEPEMYGVYISTNDQPSMWLADFKDLGDAMSYVNTALEANHHV